MGIYTNKFMRFFRCFSGVFQVFFRCFSGDTRYRYGFEQPSVNSSVSPKNSTGQKKTWTTDWKIWSFLRMKHPFLSDTQFWITEWPFLTHYTSPAKFSPVDASQVARSQRTSGDPGIPWSLPAATPSQAASSPMFEDTLSVNLSNTVCSCLFLWFDWKLR